MITMFLLSSLVYETTIHKRSEKDEKRKPINSVLTQTIEDHVIFKIFSYKHEACYI